MKTDIEESLKYDNDISEEQKIDLFALAEEFISGFRVVWPVCLILILVFFGLGYVNSVRSYSPIYESQASFTVTASYGTDNDYYNTSAASQMAKVFPYLLTSTQLSELVAEELNLLGVPGQISASVMENTNLFKLTVHSSDAQMAYDILQAVIENYPEIANKVVGNTTLQMVSEPVVPREPMNSKNHMRQAMRGALIGVLAGFLLALFYGLSRNTVRDERSLKAFTNLRCLGEIAEVKRKRYSKVQEHYIMVTDKKVDYGFRESFRSIVSKLCRTMRKKGDQIVMITSALQGEGKTTTTINLALSMAEAGQKKVILIDCDLRKPATTQAFLGKNKPEYSMHDVLMGNVSLEQALIPIGKTGVYLLPGDYRTFSGASELAGSSQMKRMFDAARENADYVVVDTSPADLMADAFAISQLVDGVLMVVRYHYANKNYVLKAMRRVAEAETTMYGYVINGILAGLGDKLSSYHYGGYRRNSYRHRYGYGYNYGYGSDYNHQKSVIEEIEEEREES